MKSSSYGAAMNAGLHAIGKAANEPKILTNRQRKRLEARTKESRPITDLAMEYVLLIDRHKHGQLKEDVAIFFDKLNALRKEMKRLAPTTYGQHLTKAREILKMVTGPDKRFDDDPS